MVSGPGRASRVSDPPELVAKVRDLYQAGRTQREIATEVGLTQKVIWRLMRTQGITARRAVPRDQRGAANNNWRTQTANYYTLHGRVSAARGTPSLCSVCGTTEASHYEWANLTGAYDDVDDYARMCVPCHRRFDLAVRRTAS
ncbi:hypothetical protein ABZ468_25670 [Streptomyces sp. NPDC005708]|uniref:hypothetical protein n=1 Tax=Streptomyces sp. NPDC005708 TaxID=3154564 RepID=UPI003403F56C